jgi:hypothetical protein
MEDIRLVGWVSRIGGILGARGISRGKGDIGGLMGQ